MNSFRWPGVVRSFAVFGPPWEAGGGRDQRWSCASLQIICRHKISKRSVRSSRRKGCSVRHFEILTDKKSGEMKPDKNYEILRTGSLARRRFLNESFNERPHTPPFPTAANKLRPRAVVPILPCDPLPTTPMGADVAPPAIGPALTQNS